jgi:hypothetical protein
MSDAVHIAFAVHLAFANHPKVVGLTNDYTLAPKNCHVNDDPNFTTDQLAGLLGDNVITPDGVVSSNGGGTLYAARHLTVELTAFR